MEQDNLNFSENNNDIINEEMDEELDEESSEQEIDPELRARLYQEAINYCADTKAIRNVEKKPPKKRRVRKVKEAKNIIQPCYDIDVELPPQKQTWKSKRLISKGCQKKEYKFTPKMVPYEYRDSTKTTEYIVPTIDDFPSL
jgi:hypothetical protein